MVRLAGDGYHVADLDLLQRLRVELARGRLFHRQDLASHGIALEPLLDEVEQRHLLVAALAKEEVLLRGQPLPHFVVILHWFAAVLANVAAVARHVADILGEWRWAYSMNQTSMLRLRAMDSLKLFFAETAIYSQ